MARPKTIPTRNGRTVWLVGLCLLSLAACGELRRDESAWSAFDRPASVVLWSSPGTDPAPLLEDVRQTVLDAERQLDRDSEDGEIAELNRRAADGFYAVRDLDVYRCLIVAGDYARASRGRFDPTVGRLSRLYERAHRESRLPTPPERAEALRTVDWTMFQIATEARAVRFRKQGMQLDLGNVAPGFAIDMALRVMARPGAEAALFSVGEVSYAWQAPPGLDAWTIAIADPREPGEVLLEVDVSDRGIAVAGNLDGEVGPRPILDPRTALPAEGDILAAVAIAHSAADAQALAYSLYASTYFQASDLLGRTRKVDAVLLLQGPSGRYVQATPGLRGRLRLAQRVEQETGGDVRYLLESPID